MDRLHLLWAFIVTRWIEIVLAAVFAILFAVIVDLLAIGSRFRAAVRHIKNKLSERSAVRLRKRIKQLENSRAAVAAYLASDKALYLATFRIVIGILVAIAVAAALSELRSMPSFPPTGPMAILFYFLAVAIGIQGFKISSLDTRAKVSEMVSRLDSEIQDLQKKLAAMAK